MRTIKIPSIEELSISCLSSNNDETQQIDLVVDKGRTVVSGIIFAKKRIDNIEGYNDEFLPYIGDKVFYDGNQIGVIYSFKSESEIFLKTKEGYKLTHKGELTFIHRRMSFLDKLKYIFR
jgi:hypothetical protein